MSKNVDDLITRINRDHLGNSAPPKERKSRPWLKKLGVALAGVGLVGAIGTYILGFDYQTKRQAFPMRDVLYQVESTVNYAGGEGKDSASLADKSRDDKIRAGHNDGTKVGQILGSAHEETSDQGSAYELRDANNNRIADAKRSDEPVQGGLRLRGTIDYGVRFAYVHGKPQQFYTYMITPERGWNHRTFNVLVDEDGTRTLVNELIESRPWWGCFASIDNYRASTVLTEFAATAENQRLIASFFAAIDALQQIKDPSATAAREKQIDQMLTIEAQLERIPIYESREDGILDWLPQESTTYLFSEPTIIQRISHLFEKAMPSTEKAVSTYPA
ncbi:hypothetical protein HZB02_00765 [Candidatus Woesearchaeota archaeon]|nr:hypothetical protein [Candidatus Woesearchaeota archaeon]